MCAGGYEKRQHNPTGGVKHSSVYLVVSFRLVFISLLALNRCFVPWQPQAMLRPEL